MFSFELNTVLRGYSRLLSFYHLNFYHFELPWFFFEFFSNLSRTSCLTFFCTYMLVIIGHFPCNFCPFVDINQNRHEWALSNWSLFFIELCMCSSFSRTDHVIHTEWPHIYDIMIKPIFSFKLIISFISNWSFFYFKCLFCSYFKPIS